MSVKHDQPITSVSWSPAGDMFVVGSYNLIRLCNANGVSKILSFNLSIQFIDSHFSKEKTVRITILLFNLILSAISIVLVLLLRNP